MFPSTPFIMQKPCNINRYRPAILRFESTACIYTMNMLQSSKSPRLSRLWVLVDGQ
jgi:hypothetical protein